MPQRAGARASSTRADAVEAPGLASRRIAADILDGVLRRRRSLQDQFDDSASGLAALDPRDRALARMIVGTALRRLGTLRALFAILLERGMPPDTPRLESILASGAAQLLWLDVPDRAAVDLAVRLAQADRRAARYSGVVNATLRRLARERDDLLARVPADADTPAWLLERWRAHYGPEAAAAISAAHAQPPPLDLMVKADAEGWAARLGGRVLPTGSVRMLAHGTIPELAGYAEGAWWVQDAAAALPARLLGNVAGKRVADLCAAPGGKAAQLAAAGAHVTAVDRSRARLARLQENFSRLSLTCEVVEADATQFEAEPFDAVLLDAPCLSTGTIRRHPDVPWLKRAEDIAPLAALQARLLDRAVALTKPGGVLVYCTCSLEPEEGEGQVGALLAREPRVRLSPIVSDEVGGRAELIRDGALRTLPCHFPDADPRWAGLDGFYAARLERVG